MFINPHRIPSFILKPGWLDVVLGICFVASIFDKNLRMETFLIVALGVLSVRHAVYVDETFERKKPDPPDMEDNFG
jgi:hypothetical protein